ncbi:MAG: heme ABC exporter ATP-binding protein CcmA [Steroidobacteraceae bacterium]
MQAFNFSRLSARDIHVWRGDRKVLGGVSVDAAAGTCVHVAGPNGSGKTTLLRVLAGFLAPEQGSVTWGGRPIGADRDAYCASFSYLAHSDGLKPELTARENLAFEVGLRRRCEAPEIDDALSRVGLAASRDQAAAVLSAGQRRRLAMARVMLAAAPLWILDEPFTNLDGTGVMLVTAIITSHLDRGGAAVLAAHQPPSIPNQSPRRVDLAS